MAGPAWEDFTPNEDTTNAAQAPAWEDFSTNEVATAAPSWEDFAPDQPASVRKPVSTPTPKNRVIDRGYDIDPTDGVPEGRMKIDRSVLNDSSNYLSRLYDGVLAGKTDEELLQDVASQRFGDSEVISPWSLKTPQQMREVLKYFRNGGKPSGVSFNYEEPKKIEPKQGETIISAPEPLSPTEVFTKSVSDAVSRQGQGLLQTIGRTIFDTPADETLDVREAQEMFWKDQARRSNNPIADEILKFGGQVIGEIDPTYFVAPGSSAAGRIAAQAGIAGATDLAVQGMGNIQGIQKGLDSERLGMNVLGGAAFEGASELVGKALKRQRVADLMKSETPEVRPSETSTQIGGTPTKPLTRTQQKRADIQQHVDSITSEWKNSPKFNVVPSVSKLPKAVQEVMKRDGALKAPAIFDEDGTAHIIASNVTDMEQVTAGIYHEALGHAGLKNLFQKDLDNALQDIYDRFGPMQKKVEEYFAREGHDKLYTQDPATRHLRGVEEVLAEMSEKGRIPPSIMDRIVAVIRKYGRQMGFKKFDRMNQTEIRHILAQAHNTVVKGDHKSSVFDGVRYMFTGMQGEMEKNVGEGKGYFDEGMNQAIDAENSTTPTEWGSDLHRETGWFMGPDGKYRREISDKNSDFKDEGLGTLITSGKVKLGELYDHPDLYKRYPHMQDMPVSIETREGYGGSYDPSTEAIALRVDRPTASARKTLLHEIQHAVQHEEDFGMGSNPDSASRLIPEKKLPGITKKAIDYYKAFENQAREREEVLTRWKEVPVLKALSEAKEHNDILDAEAEVVKSLGAKSGNIYDLLNKSFEDFEFAHNLIQVASGKMSVDDAQFKLFEQANKARSKQIELQRAMERGDEKDLRYALRNIPALGDQAYEHTFGEVEARDTARRADYSEWKREEIEPYKAEDALEPDDYLIHRRSDYENREVVPSAASRYMMAKKDMAGSINLDKIDATEDVKDLIRDMAAKMPKMPKMTEDEIVEQAIFMGMNNKKALRTLVGLKPEEIMAMRMLVEQNADRLLRLSSKIQAGTATEAQQQKFVRGMAIHAQVQARLNDQASNAGRVLRALRIQVEGKSAERAARVRAALAEMEGVDLGNPDNIKYMAELIQMSDGDFKKIAKVTRDALGPLPEDYIISLRYSMMLSGLGTHAKNFLGGLTMIGLDTLEHAGAAVLGAGRRAIGINDGSDSILFREIAMRNWGLLRALFDAQTYKNMGKSWKDGVPHHQVSKVEVANAILPGPLEAPKKALATTDSFFRSLIENADHYGMAVRTAYHEGLKGDELADRIDELIAYPSPQMVDHSNRHTAILQFISESSPIGRLIEMGKARKAEMGFGPRLLRFTLQMALPFTRVTDNLFFSAIRRVPFISVIDKITRDDWKAGGAQRDLVIARNMFGAAAIAWFYNMAEQDILSGDGPENPAARAELMATGWQPNSIRIGDTWYSLSGYDAIGISANLVANLREKFKKGDLTDEDAVSDTLNIVGAVGRQLSNATFTEQLGELMQLFDSGPQAEGRFANYTAGMASSFVPALVRNTNKTLIDESVRDTTGDGSTSDRVAGRVMNSIPGLSDNLPQRYDVFGRAIVDTGKNFLGINNSKAVDTDPVVQEVARLQKTLGKAIVGPVKRSDLKKYGIKDAESIQKYQQLSGQYIYDDLKQAMAEPSWYALTDAEKLAEIKSIKTDQRANAREDLFGEPQEDDE